VLRNGERVEIVTDANARPNPVWLSYVGTGKARSHIRHYLKTRQSEESAEVGELLLVQALRSLKANPDDVGEAHWKRFFKGESARRREEVLAESASASASR
jgi:GTP pyrophosphokinase